MGKLWVLDTETKGTGAEMVPLEKVVEEARRGRAPVLAPKRRKRVAPPPRSAPRRFRVVDVMSRQVVAEDVDTRAMVEALKGFRSVVDVSVLGWDDAAADWRPLTLRERRAVWSLRGRVG
jgi:hypothetical protein